MVRVLEQTMLDVLPVTAVWNINYESLVLFYRDSCRFLSKMSPGMDEE